MKHSPVAVAFAVLFAAATLAQNPAPPAAKGPDKEVAEKVAQLAKVVADTKFSKDGEGLNIIDSLLQKSRAGLDPKDQHAVVKALEGVLRGGKVRPPEKPELYIGAAAALGYCSAEGAKVLKAAFLDKDRFPAKPEWLRLREQLLKNLGRTKDESMVKFLIGEAKDNNDAALKGVAGEALGNFEDSKESIRKDIVDNMLKKWGELEEQRSQMGTNQQAQNASDILATVGDKWNSTLAKLTRQSFTKFSEWQHWYQKNKLQPW